jgi:hypothetical protein
VALTSISIFISRGTEVSLNRGESRPIDSIGSMNNNLEQGS